MDRIPQWFLGLEEEDAAFLKNFVLRSGSLKDIAKYYAVSYPTVRLRLDKLIQKIRMGEATDADAYIALVKRLALDDKLDFDTAKVLIAAYKKEKRETQSCPTSEFNC